MGIEQEKAIEFLTQQLWEYNYDFGGEAEIDFCNKRANKTSEEHIQWLTEEEERLENEDY
ncbi:MAG: hypothetical protein LBT10_04060 [Methanobrevibacter sp.]|jgi:hypothetical protein|nr:hypothetical protein [Methanobrevibacter sp.]